MDSPPENIPSDLQNLLNLIRLALCSPGQRTAFSLSDPSSEFSGFVARHRLGPFLFHHLPEAVFTALPEKMQTELSNSADRTTRRALIRTTTLFRIGQQLTAAKIPWLTVKGPVLAATLWGNLNHRHSGDVDIVIHPHDATKVDALLRSSGFQRTSPDFELTPRQWDQYLKTKYELGYQSMERPGLNIEIKWRLDGIEDLPAILSEPRLAEISGHPIPTLPPAANFRYLCHHGARHGWFRIFWLIDVARLVQENQTPWPEVLPRGRAESSYRPVAQALGLIQQLFLIAPPRGILTEAPTPDPMITPLQNQAVRLMSLHNDQLTGTSEWMRQLRYRTRLEPGLHGLISAISPHIFSPLNWKACPLSDRWFFLYPLLSPFLWIYRLIMRRHS